MNALKVKNSSKATHGKIQALNGIANKHFNTRNYLSALSSFEEVLNIDGVNETAYFCRIRVLKSIAQQKFEGKDYNGALSLFRTVLENNQYDEEALLGGGLCLNNLGNYDSALELFDKLLSQIQRK